MSQDGACSRGRPLIGTLNHHDSECEQVCVGSQTASHCITDSVAWYHHIKLALMNTSERLRREIIKLLLNVLIFCTCIM